MTEFDQALPAYSQPNHEEELMSLRKQMRSQEAEWKKNKAVLEQRIEILELQNRELKEREENLKKMNNSIFSALKDFNKENDPTYSKIIRELEVSKQQVSREYSDYKIRYQETMKNLEKENRDLKEKVVDFETKYNQTTLHYEKNDAALQQKLQNLENDKKNVAMVLKLYEDERKQYKDKELNQNELQSKITELRYLLEKQTGDHRREVEKVHHDYTQTINNIKSLAESEKSALENQIRRLLDSKKLDGSLFEDIKKNYESEIMILRKERDNSLKKNDGQEQQINQLNETVRAFEEKVTQQKNDNDKDQKELKKLKLKMMDVDSQMRKYEQGEKSLKQMLTEKEYKVEEVTTEYKKKLNNEKRKYEQAQELAKKYKEDGEKKCSIVMQESIKKDEVIKKLKGQIRNKEDKLNRKSDNDTNKTNTSLVNISLVSQSISTSKYNPSRSFIQEVKTTRDPSANRSVTQTKKSHSRLSRDFTSKTLGKESHRDNLDTNEDEEDPKDITNENILLGLNSPRAFNSVSTYRNHPSNKKDTELSIASSNRNNSDKQQQGLNFKKGEKSVLNMNLCDMCNHDIEINERNTEEENNSYTHREHNLNCTIAGPQNLSNASFEIKKKSASLCEPGAYFNEKDALTYSGNEIVKPTPTEYDSRNFLHINEFSDNINSINSVNHMIKNGLSLNPSVSNLSRGFQDVFENTNKSSGYQQNGYDYTEGMTRTKRSNTDDYKVKLLEDRLREAEQKANKIGLEKERLQVDLDRLILELKQTKMEWALSEESKEECELALKNEIKFLINKLLQVKNTGVSSSSSQGDLSQFTKSTLNKSTMDPQSSSFINTSGFLNFSHSNPANHFASFSSNHYEQNNMTIIHNNLGERKVNDSTEKKMVKRPQKVYSEEAVTPLKDKCMNTADFDGLSDSPRRVSEFNNNENNLLMNLLTTSTNPKKLMRHIKR